MVKRTASQVLKQIICLGMVLIVILPIFQCRIWNHDGLYFRAFQFPREKICHCIVFPGNVDSKFCNRNCKISYH